MKKRLTILSAKLMENQLFLNVNESIEGLQPATQILVDSDQFSFIYIMEDQEDYTYIVFPEQHWPILKSALERKSQVLLTFDDKHIELPNFLEELEYVISNIKDNSNYGDDMVKKVENIF